MTPVSQYTPVIAGDFVNLFLGEPLGSGIAREVYVLRTDPAKVVKVEMASESFQNIMEWTTWLDLKDTKWAKYLAPCHWISPCGIVLIQSRCSPLTPEHEKKQLPNFLTDFKRTNYGVLEGRVVCHDYGTNNAICKGASASRLHKPEWWDLAA